VFEDMQQEKKKKQQASVKNVVNMEDVEPTDAAIEHFLSDDDDTRGKEYDKVIKGMYNKQLLCVTFLCLPLCACVCA